MFQTALFFYLNACAAEAFMKSVTTGLTIGNMRGGSENAPHSPSLGWRPSNSAIFVKEQQNQYDATPSVSESPNMKTVDVLSLDSIRSSLIRQEETIIFAMIERSQFCRNSVVYGSLCPSNLAKEDDAVHKNFGKFTAASISNGNDSDSPLSFLEFMLQGTETLYASVRRYTSPDEHPFFPHTISGVVSALPDLVYPTNLLSEIGGAADINFNDVLLRRYVREAVPALTVEGDDEQYGSTVVSDVSVLQALSKRIHYGKFVAESKYLADPEGYQKLVDNGDAVSIMAKLTNEAVERQVLNRARLKAATYGRDPLLVSLPPMEGKSKRTELAGIVAGAAASAAVAAVESMGTNDEYDGKVNPSVIQRIYKEIIIPMTKDVEVAYLFKRCGKDPPEGWYGGMQ
eukprot:CAMPEP_0113309564 /NCGR_PEP_ID=MMETSP0010_2-20120614/7555_1 /TAXON_ID=216773 ORGANISM="Corethron hystrix, Strain 308" /NCGR_SAMPLE_ID=MMETSP0010_2 /ASSEMBLY_ACC=CAM_ASM_000155 /LENGTH=400 /DNA_ID=CAMNT_0000164837 /DNA_START=90 /DNA_END=1292 /DNA_ORIENTATION=+ /assembly_acc=CAM_ASM_000155